MKGVWELYRIFATFCASKINSNSKSKTFRVAMITHGHLSERSAREISGRASGESRGAGPARRRSRRGACAPFRVITARLTPRPRGAAARNGGVWACARAVARTGSAGGRELGPTRRAVSAAAADDRRTRTAVAMSSVSPIQIPSRLPLLLTHEGVLLPGSTMRTSVDSPRNLQLVRSRLLKGTSLQSTILGVIPNTPDPASDAQDLPPLHR